MSRLNYFKNRPKILPINKEAYLVRLALEQESPSLSFLKHLHRAHLLRIPFENLDIHYGRKIILDVDKIYQKIIREGRGGFCYELNALFYHLLGSLGFDISIASAQVYQEGAYSQEFEHMLLLVRLDDATYLCDIGFGELFSEPKKMTTDIPQLDFTNYYKFDHLDDYWILKKSVNNSAFTPMYRFMEQSRELIEFVPRCDYHQVSPDSKYVNTKMITQLFREGRVTLTDRLLVKNLFGEIVESPILNEDEFHIKLQENFGIDFRQLINQKLL